MKKILIGIIMLILAAAVFFAQRTLPGIMKNLAVKELDEILNTEAEIDDLKVSLWRGIISFSGVRIKNPPGFNEKYFLTVENGFVDISLFALLSKKVDVEEIVLYRPRLNIEINGISRSNAPLVFKKTPPSVAGTAKKTKMQTHLKKIVIQDGVFKLANYKVNSAGATALFDRIGITATPRKIDMEARLPASVNGNVKLSAKGDFISDKISFDADLTAEEISLPYFMPFYINTAPVIVNSGRADLRSIAKCRNNQLYAVQKVDIEDLEITVNEVNAGDSKVFGLPIANVANFFVNTDGRLSFEFEITGTLSDPEFHIGEALKKVLINSIGEALLNRLSNIPGQILGTVQESGQIGQAGKEVLEDIFQKILKPRN